MFPPVRPTQPRRHTNGPKPPSQQQRVGPSAATHAAAAEQQRIEQQRIEQELRRLTQENAGLQADVAEANERAEEVQANLLAAGEREQSLATLLACAGYDALALGPLSWTAPQAQQLLDEEAEELEKLRELDQTIQGGRARVQGLLSQQQHLSQQLSASLITVS